MKGLPVLCQGGTIRDALAAIDAGAAEIVFVVDESQRVMGAVTDGDVRRALLSGFSLESKVDHVANPEFISVPQESSRAEVLDLMRALTLAQIPVVGRDGRLVGIHLLKELVGSTPRANWAVVMAGGRGARLRPITDSIPKPMVRVAGRPILERIILHLVGHGISQIFISVNYMGEMIKDHFGSGSRFGCRINYLKETEPLGTGGALSLLPDRPADPLVVMNGDLISQVDLGAMLSFHHGGEFAATVGLREHVYEVPFGVVHRDDDRVVGIEEKPTKSWKVNCGIYVLQPSLIGEVTKGEYLDMTDILAGCFERGDPVGGFPVEGDWIDVGRRSDLDLARGEG